MCKLSSVIIPVEKPKDGERHCRDASMAVHLMSMLRGATASLTTKWFTSVASYVCVVGTYVCVQQMSPVQW